MRTATIVGLCGAVFLVAGIVLAFLDLTQNRADRAPMVIGCLALGMSLGGVSRHLKHKSKAH